ncbi:hypothetical protein [Pseudomonas sp. LB3P38]|uniref:hypothetical protein n=1 Tax=Pseudomonas lyxosi TaxID=3398358 RepID=UPI0039EED311
MALSRREILFVSSITLIAPRLSLATSPDLAEVSHEDTQTRITPAGPAVFKDKFPTDYQPMCTMVATNAEESLARKILDGVPSNCSVIDVAIYFHDVGQGKFGDDRKQHIMAWPVQWNQVIVQFFKATKLQPSGVASAWCATYMNYCLMKAATGKTMPAGASPQTLIARALSFRNGGKTTDCTRPNDIVVFKNVKSSGNGHAGFFLADQGDKILTLWGNQFEGIPKGHTINRKTLLQDGQPLKLHTYCTEEQLVCCRVYFNARI